MTADAREKLRQHLAKFYHPALARQFYGLPEAANDLAVEPNSGEPIEIKLMFPPRTRRKDND